MTSMDAPHAPATNGEASRRSCTAVRSLRSMLVLVKGFLEIAFNTLDTSKQYIKGGV